MIKSVTPYSLQRINAACFLMSIPSLWLPALHSVVLVLLPLGESGNRSSAGKGGGEGARSGAVRSGSGYILDA